MNMYFTFSTYTCTKHLVICSWEYFINLSNPLNTVVNDIADIKHELDWLIVSNKKYILGTLFL